MNRILVLDNYDSFTFNLVQALGALGADVVVERNDQVTVADIEARRPDGIVISPGPGGPAGAGLSEELVRWCASTMTPLLGVCLGHQAIAEVYGARIVRAPRVMHGKTTTVRHSGAGVFAGLPDPFEAMRYHSLVADRASLPDEIEVTAWSEDLVMGLRHRDLPIEGVQFHPESVLTVEGPRLLENYVRMATGRR